MLKTYKVELRKQAAYYAEVYVKAESPADAKLAALEMDGSELNWDYSDPFCDTEVNRVVDHEEKNAAQLEWAKRQEEIAKEVRVVAKPFSATRLSDGSTVRLVPGVVLTDFSEDLYGPLSIDFNSTHGRCRINYDEVFRETGCGPYKADDSAGGS